MNIKARINARKVVLSYIYQHCFFDNLENQDNIAVESLFIDNIFKTDNSKFDDAKKDYLKNIEKYTDQTVSEESLTEFVKMFFWEWIDEDIDFQYIFDIWQAFEKYMPELEKIVNKYIESFKYEDMDIMDRAIFILGYTERKVLETPKEVLINEMIELAKRYSDEWAPKLLNWIMHKIVTA